jgi:hypothetical protein
MLEHVFSIATGSRRSLPAMQLRGGLNLRRLLVIRALSLESGVSFSVHVAISTKVQTTISIIAGILPIIRWLISLERNPPPTRNLLTIERIQGWSMLAYYPLEHIYYLNTQGIIPHSIPSPLSLFSSNPKHRMKINPGWAVTWSCRCWALYVALQLLHIAEDRQLLLKRERMLKKAKDFGPAAAAEKAELRKKWDALYNELVLNLSNLPMALHWFVLFIRIFFLGTICVNDLAILLGLCLKA